MRATITYRSRGSPPDFIDRGTRLGAMDTALAVACESGRIMLLDFKHVRVVGDELERTVEIEVMED